MGQTQRASLALIISEDDNTRQISSILFEESGFRVLEAATIEQAEAVLLRDAKRLQLVFADARDGLAARDLAHRISKTWPWIRVLVSLETSSQDADWPQKAAKLHEPWFPLDLLIEAERALH
ncbi:MAG: hypothetical protein K2X62_14405 [Beijerinckiaceae bacterium]|jgi:two-component system, cell cycle response regulator CpdR|nr:hypothetical protein [Beijerinckiaceae bacterium]MDO9442322.1 hypothetical protein [Beijerinckiaceae bacterium]